MKYTKVIINGQEYLKPAENGNIEVDGEAKFSEKAKSIAADVMKAAEGIGKGAAAVGGRVLGAVNGVVEKIRKEKEADDAFERLIGLLPYLADGEKHEVFLRLMAEIPRRNPDLAKILPYLSDRDCDALFCHALACDADFDPAEMVAYVSMPCLSRVVDGYLAGQYPHLEIEALYPFLNEADVKRLTDSLLGKSGV